MEKGGGLILCQMHRPQFLMNLLTSWLVGVIKDLKITTDKVVWVTVYTMLTSWQITAFACVSLLLHHYVTSHKIVQQLYNNMLASYEPLKDRILFFLSFKQERVCIILSDGGKKWNKKKILSCAISVKLVKLDHDATMCLLSFCLS